MMAIAQYEIADITEAVSVLDDEQLREFSLLIKKIHNKLEGMKVDVVKRKERRAEIPTVTKEQKLTALIARIQAALDKYESTDDVDEWVLDFTIGMKFDDEEFVSIQGHHTQLMNVESKIDGVKLLACMERGRIYDFLKYSKDGEWGKLCLDSRICRRTADRYIDFSRIICAYPRLLICGISFEAIVCMYRKLQEHLLRDDTLAHRLQLPLRQTSIKCNTVLFSTDHVDIEVLNPPMELATEHDDWQSGWQLSDEIIESREIENSSDDTWYEAESGRD